MKGRRAPRGFYPLPVWNSWKTEEEPSETNTTFQESTKPTNILRQELGHHAKQRCREERRVLLNNLLTSEWSNPEEPQASMPRWRNHLWTEMVCWDISHHPPAPQSSINGPRLTLDLVTLQTTGNPPPSRSTTLLMPVSKTPGSLAC